MVIDTGIFIEHLRAKNKLTTTLYRLPEDGDFYISAVTLYELYMGATTPEKFQDVKDITEDLIVLPMDQFVAQQAAEIYHDLKKRNKIIEFRDIFIAATCLANDLPIATLNKKHFKRVANLKFAN